MELAKPTIANRDIVGRRWKVSRIFLLAIVGIVCDCCFIVRH